MMRRALLLTLLFFFAPAVYGQGIRFDSQVSQELLTNVLVGTSNVVVIPTGATISFCNFPANAVPCSNKATTYTTNTLGTPCSTSTQIVLVNTTTCVANPDAQENWGVWVAAGQYAYTITVSGTNLGPYNVTAGIPAGTNLSVGTLTAGATTLGSTTVGTLTATGTTSLVSGSSQYANGSQLYQVLGINSTPVTVNTNSSSGQQMQTSAAIPAGALNTVGRTFRIKVYGTMNPVNNTEQTGYDINIIDGGVGGEITFPEFFPNTAVTAYSWTMEVTCTTTVTGSSGTLACNGNLSVGTYFNSTTNVGGGVPWSAQSQTPINLTHAITLSSQISFGTASISNSGTSNFMIVEQLQ